MKDIWLYVFELEQELMDLNSKLQRQKDES